MSITLFRRREKFASFDRIVLLEYIQALSQTVFSVIYNIYE